MASIQQKITLTSIAIFVLAGGATGTGLWSVLTFAKKAEEITYSSKLLQNHMQANMMHNALRGDVLASL